MRVKCCAQEHNAVVHSVPPPTPTKGSNLDHSSPAHKPLAHRAFQNFFEVTKYLLTERINGNSNYKELNKYRNKLGLDFILRCLCLVKGSLKMLKKIASNVNQIYALHLVTDNMLIIVVNIS